MTEEDTMNIVRAFVLVCLATLVSACATTEEDPDVMADNSNGCRKVHIAGTRFPKTVCTTGSEGLSDVDKDRLRDAIGGPIVTEPK